MKAALLATALLLLGCQSSSDAPPTDGPGVPDPFRFVLDNQGGNAVYVERSCVADWVQLLDPSGRRVEMFEDCSVCNCDECSSCELCDCELGFDAVAIGTRRELFFDGFIHPLQEAAGCGTCQRPETLPPGEYTARFCYAILPDARQERDCQDVEFSYPRDAAEVVLRLTQ